MAEHTQETKAQQVPELLLQEHSLAPPERSPALQDRSPAPPERSLAPPEHSPALQERSPAPPERSLAPPERSLAPPEHSPALQERSLAPPERSLAPPEHSPEPQERRPAPQECLPAPQERSLAPPERSLAPPERSPALQECSPAPQERSLAPPERSLAPPERSPALQERSLAPPEHSPALQERSLAPQERSLAPPEHSPALQERSLAPPEHSPALPERSLAPPERSLAPPERSPEPPERSPAPPERSPAPQERPPEPQERLPAPQECSPAPQEHSLAPPERSLAPPERSTAPQERSPAPQERPPEPPERPPEPPERPPAHQERSPAPQEHLSPTIELHVHVGDKMEEQPVCTSSLPIVSSAMGTEHNDVHEQQGELEYVEHDLPLISRQSTYLQEEASTSVSETMLHVAVSQCSPQAVHDPEVHPLGGINQSQQDIVTAEQGNTCHELSVGDSQPVCTNQTPVEVDVQANSLGKPEPDIPTVTPDSITAALINEDTNSSQDFIKDAIVKPLASLDATTDASGRSTPNIDVLKDMTGRDSPGIRSLKEDSGRDSPSQRCRRRICRDSVVTEANEANMGIFPAENLFEYQWPQEKGSEWYFVQEQVSEFLQVKSFKRKYPDLERRVMDINEKDFLRERGVVTEEQVTLGLTALRADEVYDLMLKDAPDKSAEYARVLHEKEKQNISNKHKQYEAPSVDSNKVQEYVKKAVRQAADYNSALMAERREERQYYFDMQTLTVQMPTSRMKKQDKEASKLGPYPVAVIPGQYQNYYRSYSSDELKYFPLNTSLYGPVAPCRQTDLAPPLSNDETDQLSDNDTVLSTENFDSSSGFSDHEPTPMDMDSHENVELDTADDRTTNITLPNDPSVYKPVAVRELEPCLVVGLERPKDIPNAICGLCLKNSSENKMGVPEKMIHCSQCDNSGHPTCLEMTQSMVEVIQTYPWQCMECKTCFHCGDPTHEDKMMFCDMCDRGYHTFCVGLQDIPTGLWACESCEMRDVPAALAPHVPTPPLLPTPPPAEPSLGAEPPSPQPAESTPANKKKGRRSATPASVPKQSTPGMKRSKTSTPTPKRVKKK